MIVQQPSSNNFVHFKLQMLAALLVFSALLLSACGKGDSSKTGRSEDSSAPTADLCGITIDDSAWRAFESYCVKAENQEPVARSDYQVYADLPIIARWKESMDSHLPSVRIVNWLESAFSGEDDRGAEAKHNLDRRHFRNSYLYTQEHYREISPLIEKFQSAGHCCGLRDKVQFWIEPDVLPDSLVIAFFPSKPEIRILDNYLFVDTGVLQAGNLNQLERQLAGMLFRSTMMMNGDSPTGTDGEFAVANSVRMMMNEGIIDYIQDQPATLFSPQHPKLGKVNIIPEFVFDHGRKAISLINFHLPKMLDDPNVMEKNGRNLAKTLTASSSLRQGGYSMSATIATHLGDERLRQTVGSPSAWLAAYQEAALLNPSPAPEAYEVSTKLHLCMPPFDEPVYEGLQAILSRVFPSKP